MSRFGRRTDALSGTKKLTVSSVMVAAAMVFSYIEFLLPVSAGIPGVKLGIANIVTVFCLYTLGDSCAFWISAVRIGLSALLFGNAFSAVYAFAGGAVSFVGMSLLKKADIFSVTAVSAAGGVLHNFAQTAAAALIMENSRIFLYFPLLLISGAAAGFVNGILSVLILRRVKWKS